MNRLTLFVVLLFVIGLILVIISFTAYSKITESCKSKKLRSYLRWCVGVGSVLLTIGIMYFVCTKKEGCKCDFDIDAGWKIYLTLFILVVMGGFLVYLVAGIQREIKSGGCDIDLGSLLEVLWGISIAQIVLPLIYTGIVLYTKKSGSSLSKDDDEYYEDEGESENRERLADKSIELEKDISSIDKQLTKYTTELSALKREKVKKKDLDASRKKIKVVSSKISGLENRLKKAKSDHSSIESKLSSGATSSSGSSVSSNSSGGLSKGLGGGFGGGFGGGGFGLGSGGFSSGFDDDDEEE